MSVKGSLRFVFGEAIRSEGVSGKGSSSLRVGLVKGFQQEVWLGGTGTGSIRVVCSGKGLISLYVDLAVWSA